MLGILQSTASLGLLWALMTIGVFITYRVLDYADLTVEGSITLGAAIAARLIFYGANPYLATALSFLGGMCAGAVTGLLHTKLKIPGLLSGILSMIALYSINIRIMGKANVSLLRMDNVFTPIEALGSSPRNAVLILGLIAVIIVICTLYWFFGTELGSSIRATGNNPGMMRAQGVNTDNMKLIGLMLSNGLVSLSGALIAQNQGFADIQMGTGAIVIGLASVIIGEVIFGTRNFMNTLISLVLGAVTYRIIIAAVLELGMEPTDLKLFTAITVAIALSLPIVKRKIAARKGLTSEEVRKHA